MPSVTSDKTLPHYAAVGQVAATWAKLEHQIQVLIWRLAGLDDLTGTCITAQIGNSGRLLDAVLALLEQRGASKDNLKPLRSLCGDIADKQRKRNRIIHDPWYFRFNEDGTATGHRLETTAAKTAVHGLIREDKESLEAFIGEIHSLYLKLTDLVTPWLGKASS
jgi:hypothetical protein